MTKYITCKCGHEMEAPKDAIKGCYYRPLALTCPECKRTGCWDWSEPSTPIDDELRDREKEQVTKAEHTPVPWRIVNANCKNVAPVIYSGDVAFIATLNQGNHLEVNANAKFIVTAVNSHDALLAALIDTRDRIKDSGEWWFDSPERGGLNLDMIEAAIAKAGMNE